MLCLNIFRKNLMFANIKRTNMGEQLFCNLLIESRELRILVNFDPVIVLFM